MRGLTVSQEYLGRFLEVEKQGKRALFVHPELRRVVQPWSRTVCSRCGTVGGLLSNSFCLGCLR